MPTFAFVNVPIGEETYGSRRRNRGISAKDALLIRSLAASHPRNRRRGGENGEATKAKRKAGAKSTKTARQADSKQPASSIIPSPGTVLTPEEIWFWDVSMPAQTSSWSPFSYLHDLLPQSSGENDTVTESSSTPDPRQYLVELDPPAELAAGAHHGQEMVTQFCSRMVGHVRSGRIDPFWAFSIPFRPCLSAAINHRFTYLSPRRPELDKYFEENACRKYSLVAMHDPAFMFCDALFSATDLYLLGQDPSTERPIREADLIWLRGSAYGAVYKVLQKEGKTVNQLDTCIGALMVLACYEKCFGGDVNLLSMHVRAMLDLIQQRGGMQNILECHRRMIEYMEIEYVIVDKSMPVAASAPEEVWSDLTPGWAESQKGRTEIEWTAQPYTNTWIFTKVREVGSSIFRGSNGPCLKTGVRLPGVGSDL